MTDTFPMYDKKEQFQDIEEILIQGEKISVVFDIKDGAGCLGITNLRVIVYDRLSGTKTNVIVSIPYSRIHTVAAEDESGLFRGGTSQIVIKTSGDEYRFKFEGTGKGKIAHDLILGFLVRPAH